MLKKLQSQNGSDFNNVTLVTFFTFPSRRLLRFRLILERGFHLLDDSLERGFVGDREIGKNLAVEPNIRGFQTLGETAVGETLRADGGVEPLDPKITERAFARLAIAIRPILGLHRRVLRVTEKFGTAPAESLGLVEDAFASLPAGGSISCSWHFSLARRGGPFLSANCSFC